LVNIHAQQGVGFFGLDPYSVAARTFYEVLLYYFSNERDDTMTQIMERTYNDEPRQQNNSQRTEAILRASPYNK
jgi:hypothetical protein